MYVRRLECCGIMELSGLSFYPESERAMKEFAKACYEPYSYNNDIHCGPRFRYVLFSQARVRARYGMQFAAFIKQNKLGDVIETKFNLNPNSGNKVKAFLWTVDHDAFKAWWLEQKKPKPVEPVEPVVNGQDVQLQGDNIPILGPVAVSSSR